VDADSAPAAAFHFDPAGNGAGGRAGAVRGMRDRHLYRKERALPQSGGLYTGVQAAGGEMLLPGKSSAKAKLLRAPQANVLFQAVSVLFQAVSVLFQAVSVLFQAVSVLFQAVSVLFQAVSVLFQAVSVLFQAVGIL